MPLADKDRMALFGAIFVEFLKEGDNIDAIREMQYDDLELAISIFWKVFGEVCIELTGLNSWISISEAELLFRTLLPSYGITNADIWWAVFNQDPTLHVWKQQQSFGDMLERRKMLVNGDKKDFDRQMVIQSYISQFMVGTSELQTSPMMERREFLFFDEVKRLVKLLAENKIKCSPEELKSNIMRVFPGLSRQSYLLSMIDKYFAAELQAIKGEDFVIDYGVELTPVEEKPKEAEIVEIKELTIEPAPAPQPIATDEESTVSPKEPSVSVAKPTPKLVTLKMAPESIANYLNSFMTQFNDNKELKNKAKEELAKIRKTYVTNSKKLRSFFMILGELVKLYSQKYNYKKTEDIQNLKIAQIYAAVNALHTAIGNDTATITEHQQIIAKAQ